MENVDVLYQDYEVEYSATEIQTSPMLVIEKVDADKALYRMSTMPLQGQIYR